MGEIADLARYVAIANLLGQAALVMIVLGLQGLREILATRKKKKR